MDVRITTTSAKGEPPSQPGPAAEVTPGRLSQGQKPGLIQHGKSESRYFYLWSAPTLTPDVYNTQLALRFSEAQETDRFLMGDFQGPRHLW
jgi:hypothetical protein